MKLKRSKNRTKSPNEIKTTSHSINLPEDENTQIPRVDLGVNLWKILIVDDEPDVHEMTRIGLKGFSFDGKKLELVSAHSARQAKDILQKDRNFAAAFIDVVMETEEAGLDLVRFIREDLKLSHIRLIIRTGQPGKAPERFVIDNFDIDDYKEKSVLTNLKMYTVFRSAIKSYRDILIIERNRLELEEKVEERTKELCKSNEKLEVLVSDLQKAVGEVKQLSGLLPICSYCKKIKDDEGYWNQIESYIDAHSEASFSHGICQECLKIHFPDLDLEDICKNNN